MNDHIGKKFGKLTATDLFEKRILNNGKKALFWKCLCDCGGVSYVRRAMLMNGNTKSCGCGRAENAAKLFTTHGHSKNNKESPTYYSWHNMIKRCTMPSCIQYKDYGGRGISICEEWLSFESFLADMGERPKGKTLDRINMNGNYDPTNCKWSTVAEQNINKRSNRVLTLNGKSMCVSEWARFLGVNEATIRCRIDRYGWSIERALTTTKKK
jgi:hypothetical protein